LDNKESTLGIFIDIEGAFDKTTFPTITQQLNSRNVPLVVGEWKLKMLSSRAISINVEDITVRALVMKGCPQGGVLSPYLWNIVLDTLINHLNNNGFYTIAYADDIVILLTGKFVNTLCDRAQDGLKLIKTWCKEHSLSINPDKTEMVLFTRKKKFIGLKTSDNSGGCTMSHMWPKCCGSTLTLPTLQIEISYER